MKLLNPKSLFTGALLSLALLIPGVNNASAKDTSSCYVLFQRDMPDSPQNPTPNHWFMTMTPEFRSILPIQQTEPLGWHMYKTFTNPVISTNFTDSTGSNRSASTFNLVIQDLSTSSRRTVNILSTRTDIASGTRSYSGQTFYFKGTDGTMGTEEEGLKTAKDILTVLYDALDENGNYRCNLTANNDANKKYCDDIIWAYGRVSSILNCVTAR